MTQSETQFLMQHGIIFLLKLAHQTVKEWYILLVIETADKEAEWLFTRKDVPGCRNNVSIGLMGRNT
jgi:hypothetical protein